MTTILTGSHEPMLVALSYAISVFGAFTALQLAGRIRGAKGQERWIWLVGAAAALGGGGVWSMHFIAMLAFKLPSVFISYDIGITLASLVAAIVVAGIGLFFVTSGRLGYGKLAASGLFVGLGVATMHYTGMAAMRLPATISYDTTLFAASVIIAIVVATVALWLLVTMRTGWQKFLSAFVMGVAVCGMHYTAMAAARFTYVEAKVDYFASAISTPMLAVSIAVATALVLSLALVYLFIDEINKLNELAG